MGGGVVATLALTRPELLDGIILEAPMLTVSDDIKPPWIIQMLFKVRLPCAGAGAGVTGRRGGVVAADVVAAVSLRSM